jgi:hypothetical protein
VKYVHDKIRDHNCTQCDFATTAKIHLAGHVKFKHDKIRHHK